MKGGSKPLDIDNDGPMTINRKSISRTGLSRILEAIKIQVNKLVTENSNFIIFHGTKETAETCIRISWHFLEFLHQNKLGNSWIRNNYSTKYSWRIADKESWISGLAVWQKFMPTKSHIHAEQHSRK